MPFQKSLARKIKTGSLGSLSAFLSDYGNKKSRNVVPFLMGYTITRIYIYIERELT